MKKNLHTMFKKHTFYSCFSLLPYKFLRNFAFAGGKNSKTTGLSNVLLCIIFAIAFVFSDVGVGYSQTGFNYTGGLQYYTVPAGYGGVIIECYGAQGGNGGGYGAYIKGSCLAAAGTQLKIMVGGAGGAGTQGGGGGGTFVALSSNNSPLVVAGGGGGLYYSSYSSGNGNMAGTTGNNGMSGYVGNTGAVGGAGGSGGYGGGCAPQYASSEASGGGGFYGNGSSCYGTGGGASFVC